MRHLNRNAKLGRKGSHRNAMLANLVCSLIKHKRVVTTLAKAKAARPVAEKLLTFGKENTLHARRLVAARLRQQARTLHRRKEDRLAWRQNEDVVRILFEDLAPGFKDRQGGYTRIIKLNQRRGDAAQTAILEWVDSGDVPEKTGKSSVSTDSAAKAGAAAGQGVEKTTQAIEVESEEVKKQDESKDTEEPTATSSSQSSDSEASSEDKKDDKA